MEIFDLRAPTAVDQSDTTDNCPDSMVVAVSFRVKLARKIRIGTCLLANTTTLKKDGAALARLGCGGSKHLGNFKNAGNLNLAKVDRVPVLILLANSAALARHSLPTGKNRRHILVVYLTNVSLFFLFLDFLWCFKSFYLWHEYRRAL